MNSFAVGIIASALLATAGIGSHAANVSFTCHAARGDECAFLVWDERPGRLGSSAFVLDSGQTHELTDQWLGAYYCVNAGPKRQPSPTRPGCKDDMTKRKKSFVVGRQND